MFYKPLKSILIMLRKITALAFAAVAGMAYFSDSIAAEPASVPESVQPSPAQVQPAPDTAKSATQPQAKQPVTPAPSTPSMAESQVV